MTTQHSTPGLFQRGGPGGPGRPKGRRENREYIEAIKTGFPPDRILDLLEEALDLAIETRSWRGLLAVVEFAAAYTLGKPKQTVQSTGSVSLAELLADVDGSKPLLGEFDGDGSGAV